MQQRRGTAAEWTAADPVLAAGEIGYETDTGKFKFGDGTNTWSNLEAFSDASAIIGAAPATLDTLAELAAAIDDNPEFYSEVAANAAAITQLNTDMAAGDVTLQGNIDTVSSSLSSLSSTVTDVQSDVSDNAAAIAAETTTRIADIATVTTNLSTEQSERIAADSSLSDDITAEATARAAADGVLAGDISSLTVDLSSESTARQAADTAHAGLTTNVHGIADTSVLATDQDITDAIAGVTSTLQASIDGVESDYITADSSLQTNIDNEATARADADTVIAGNLTTEIANRQQADSDHAALTTNVHGIADTSVLATDTDVSSAVSTHAAITTNVHGIADTSVLATDADVAAAQSAAEGHADGEIVAHAAVTTNVHGIADTSDLALLSAVDQTFDGNITIAGNFTVTGTTTTVSTQDLVVNDPMIYIGEGSTSNTADLGLVGSFDDGTYQHAGIVRDSSEGIWKLFKGVTDEPSTTINFAQGSLDDLAVNNVEVAGVVFTDGTQTKVGVPSITPIAEKTTNYTLSSSDERDTIIEVNSASATTLTIPEDATLNFPVGTTLDVIQTGAGQVTIAGTGSAVVNGTPGTKLRTQWSSVTLLKRAANSWLVFGDTAA